MEKIPVAVLGATGAVGQRFVQLLEGHPWFQVVVVTGSERTASRRYSEACRWILPEPMPDSVKELQVLPSDPELVGVPLVFSALPAANAREIEPQFARAGSVVCSNASAFRYEPDVPILLPEVNPEHTGLVEVQRRNRQWNGAIVTNPNCTSTGLTVTLKALQDAFGVRKVFVVSLQALSGAGYPGVPSLDILDNVVPYIGGEEEKVELEPRKMLGKLQGDGISPAEFVISAHTNRVPVSDGHIVCMSIELEQAHELMAVRQAIVGYSPPEICKDLPSTPRPVFIYRDEPDRPQPRLDRITGNGMTTVVGRLRPDPLFHVKMVVLSHNTIRGAAGGSIYNAELMVRQGLLA
jgi:aspartate-semialdehyde dehydrogenase